MFRESCLDCTRKHLAQALILFTESQMGYPEHYWLAIGHLSEAEAESLFKYPALADRIHKVKHRILNKLPGTLEECDNIINLIKEATKLDK